MTNIRGFPTAISAIPQSEPYVKVGRGDALLQGFFFLRLDPGGEGEGGGSTIPLPPPCGFPAGGGVLALFFPVWSAKKQLTQNRPQKSRFPAPPPPPAG